MRHQAIIHLRKRRYTSQRARCLEKAATATNTRTISILPVLLVALVSIDTASAHTPIEASVQWSLIHHNS
ncbi:hypothetical protein BCR41DRAFT_344121 [Lobosporangium transversale]|uniref:Uncharacterized protein n=1 Tax=Lobosporangium transversale TaxID=64571 RepID=A0A1Y2H2Q4_9FUNG|nr:hypothetical protein BCR41DRAFT_344121 [Lobosporangium transversale]ORZ28815.1 hypothetical protein BCR41DRAFT_344121 [Lobosporangium transversale]|eukprot:XP_021886488.1 hypothetical protein BCR41DRAFT_344121 [Lobosporangium transversale]